MSLDVGLAIVDVSSYPSIRMSFEDDGYYWFCYPYFAELEKRTGQMIDLYGGASFTGPQLDDLDRTIDEIAARAAEMAHEWEQCTGHSIGSRIAPTPPTPIYSTVRRDQLLSMLAQLSAVVDEARRDGKTVAFIGD